MSVAELDEGQTVAIEELRQVLDRFAAALIECRRLGLEPVDSFRACGIEIPAMAAPLVNRMLGDAL